MSQALYSCHIHLVVDEMRPMFSRLLLWLLLVLIPFQSFAAIGLIQCADRGSNASQVHHSSSQVVTDAIGLGVHNSNIGSAVMLQNCTIHSLTSQSNAHALADTAHHSHKLPCCSDGAIIFSPAMPLALQSERFTMAVNPEPVGLTSVFLEGPKRPPRLTLS